MQAAQSSASLASFCEAALSNLKRGVPPPCFPANLYDGLKEQAPPQAMDAPLYTRHLFAGDEGACFLIAALPDSRLKFENRITGYVHLLKGTVVSTHHETRNGRPFQTGVFRFAPSSFDLLPFAELRTTEPTLAAVFLREADFSDEFGYGWAA